MIKTAIQPNGGIPYGHEFEYAPDIDDTAMLIVLYGKMKRYFKGTELFTFYQNEINRSYSWIKSTQNSDGGFAAFDGNKNDGQYKLMTLLFWITQIDKSA